MAKNSLKKERELIKEKTRRLGILITEFLEKDITEAYLKEHQEEIYNIKDILEKNLELGNISPHDPDWQFESDECEEDVPERSAIIRQDNIDTGIKTIISFHQFLRKGFWEEFKENVLAYNDAKGSNPYLNERFIKFNPGQDVTIQVTFPDKINFFSSGIEAMRCLMNLIQGLKPEQFKKCADKNCGKLIFLTTEHKKDYCNIRCAARSIERKKREANKTAFNEYHKAWYKKNLMKGGNKG
jgi:hypothetical protein